MNTMVAKTHSRAARSTFGVVLKTQCCSRRLGNAAHGIFAQKEHFAKITR